MGGTRTRIDDRSRFIGKQVGEHRARAQKVTAHIDRDGSVEHGEVDCEGIAVLHDYAKIGSVDMRAIEAAKS
jgi:hypothetical protein